MNNAEQIWNHLIAAGLSPCGAAALMGNLYAESTLEPTNLQNSFNTKLSMTDAEYTAAVDDGSYASFVNDGAGYGLAQWTHSTRKNRLRVYARSVYPASIGDLTMQLKFLCYELQGYYPAVWAALKTAADIRYASDLVLTQYEKPADQGQTQRNKRAAYAQSYYDQYAKEGKNMTANELRTLAVQYMTSRAKLNSYTQGGNRIYFFGKPDNTPGNTTQKGYSDCSSAVRAAIKAATGIDIGSNTSAQINNRTKKGVIVHETTGYYPDESKLLPGDCLYFKGNTSHPLDVGHVEMYIGNGQCCGHGSGTGPVIHNMRDYCKDRATAKRRYFMAIRWIPDDGSENTPADPNILRYGMNDNPDVKLLQLNLISLDYNLGKWGADGDFGSATMTAVSAFQQNNGLPVTGIADSDTQAAIKLALEGLSDSDDEVPIDVPITNGVTIAPGTWNVRTGPGTEFASAGIVRGNEQYEKAELNGWTPIIYNGEVRFIGASAVKK